MVPGAPEQARWLRTEPRREWPREAIDRMIAKALRRRIVAIEPLLDGLRNANFKVHIDGVAAPVVLRIYEHDPSLCQKEIDLLRLVSDCVPVAEVLHAEPRGLEELPPYSVLAFVEGISFRALRRTDDWQAIGQAAFSAGEVLAGIGRHNFEKPGWIAVGPTVGPPLLEGDDPIPRFVDRCLQSAVLQERLAADVRERASALMWQFAAQLRTGDEACLVHGDFGKRNILVRPERGRWSVAAVLDWEFAVAGCPLADIANFLRYETEPSAILEPHFTNGFTSAGGTLPDDWRRLSKLIDLAALCELLTRAQLPDDVAVEVAGIVQETAA